MTRYRYKAFLSYSHRDERWAAGLHRSLESYRLPTRLVGRDGKFGEIPKTLSPVFRDREDHSSAVDLNEKTREALRDSEALVVVCSQDAAKSRWVNEEIRYFKSLGRSDRIFCIFGADYPLSEEPDSSWFPPALLSSESGTINEPLAADARKFADGQTLAKLKLVAGILGIRLDDLRRREQQKKRKLQAIAVLSMLAVVVLLISAIYSNLAEKARREHAETLVVQIVEISKGINKDIDLVTLRGINERLVAYLNTIDPGDLTPESNLQIALVLRQSGDVSRLQGQPDDAMSAFEQSRSILNRLVEDYPDDLNALFESGQADFWVAYIHVDRGEWGAAEIAFKRYLKIGQILFKSEPENAAKAMEVAYALSNLGTIEQRRMPVDPDKVLVLMQSTMEYNQQALALAPDDDVYKQELAETHANLADAWLNVCNLQGALQSRLVNTNYAARFYQNKPNNRLKETYSYSLAGLAWVKRQLGQNTGAMQNLERSAGLLRELSRQDPSNLNFKWNLYKKSVRLTDLHSNVGNTDQALANSAELEREFRKLDKEDEAISLVNNVAVSKFLRNYANLVWQQDEINFAKQLLNESIERMDLLLALKPDAKKALHQKGLAMFSQWQQAGEPTSDDTFKVTFADKTQVRSCDDANLAARQAIQLGDKNTAKYHTNYLLGKGYREPGFMRFCQRYELCDKPPN